MGGRKSKYDTHIKINFNKIDLWLNDGATEKNIAKKLGVSYAAWNKYKVKYKEFGELCSKPREGLIDDLRGALVKRALGMKVTETKTYTKAELDASGRPTGKKFGHIEKTEKELPPDTTAIFGALNLYDPEYVKDKKQHELKEQELELRKQQVEKENW